MLDERRGQIHVYTRLDQTLTALDLPLPPRALSASGDGETLVVAFAQEVHAFRIDEEAAR